MGRLVVLGASGSGKSYYAGALLEQTVPEFDLAVHMDIEDEEKGLSDANHDALYGTLYVSEQHAKQLNWTKVVARHKKIRIVPEGLTKDEERELYAVLCGVVMKLCKDLKPEWSAFISCDEAHNLLKQNAFPDRVERMITGGRKHGVECMHIAQRAALLHTTVVSQSDRRIYFNTGEPNDISKIDKMSAFPASKLKSLPARRCIVENRSNGEWVEVDTDGVNRVRPHYSDDDGIVDQKLPV